MKIVFASCLIAAAAVHAHALANEALSPERAIAIAERAAPAPVKGVFEMDIKAVGHSNGSTFLNSEEDYRDQSNLSIKLLPSVEAELKRTLAVADLDATLKGRHIRVDGKVLKVKVWYSVDGERSDKFYYQTRVVVRDADHIHFIR